MSGVNLWWNIVSCGLVSALLWRFVPRQRIREAWVSFLFTQVIAWSAGGLIYNAHLISAPVRLFPAATHQNVMTAYFIFPALSALYYIHFPMGRFKRFLCTCAYSGVVALLTFCMDAFTDLLRFDHWNAAHYFVFSLVTLPVCRWFTLWFFRKPYPVPGGDVW
ncbi:CBO0543 family protein [Paenibacillus sp. y28]|uniref:CBO0543 family protein n=1 Tax=Paenibacillus sp. y28 TaxID=3129110 RepID=UPI0030165FB2